jgi:putative SOS response-associated peptidase YedK
MSGSWNQARSGVLVQTQTRNYFLVAAFYRKNRGSSGYQMVLLTREAIPAIQTVHGRMPVLLAESLLSQWMGESPLKFDSFLLQLQSSP